MRPAETLYQVTLSKLVEAFVFCETREWISSECGVFLSPILKSRMMSHSKPVSAISAEVFNADDPHRADVRYYGPRTSSTNFWFLFVHSPQ